MCWWWNDFELFFRNIFFLYSVFFTFPSLSLFCFVVLREILLSRSVHFKITYRFYSVDIEMVFISSHFNISLHFTQLILYTAKYIFFKAITKQIEINDSSTFFFCSSCYLCSWNWNKYLNWKNARCMNCDVRWKLHVCNMEIWIFIIVVYPL